MTVNQSLSERPELGSLLTVPQAYQLTDHEHGEKLKQKKGVRENRCWERVIHEMLNERVRDVSSLPSHPNAR